MCSSCSGTCFDISIHCLRTELEGMREERDLYFDKYDTLRSTLAGTTALPAVQDPVARTHAGDGSALVIPSAYEYSVIVIDTDGSAQQVTNTTGTITLVEGSTLTRTRRADGQAHNPITLTLPAGVTVYYEYDPA